MNGFKDYVGYLKSRIPRIYLKQEREKLFISFIFLNILLYNSETNVHDKLDGQWM